MDRRIAVRRSAATEHRRDKPFRPVHPQIIAHPPIDQKLALAGIAARFAFARRIAPGMKQEMVQPIGCVRIILADSVIDKHRKPQRISQQDGGIDNRIIAPQGAPPGR